MIFLEKRSFSYDFVFFALFFFALVANIFAPSYMLARREKMLAREAKNETKNPDKILFFSPKVS